MQVLLLLLKEVRGRLLERNPYRREPLQLRDGVWIALDWVDADPVPMGGPDLPVCVLLHGAFMDSSSVTMSDMARTLAARGFPSVVMNRRGYGGISLDGAASARVSFYGFDEDLDDVLEAVARREPGRAVAVIGFSCGAAFALRYAGNRGGLSAWSGRGSTSRSPEGRKLPPLLCVVSSDGGYDASPQGAPAYIRWPYSWIVNWSIKYFYVFRHRHPLRKAGLSDVVRRLLRVITGLRYTYKEHMHLCGLDSVDSFLDVQQSRLKGIEVPSLLINSRDDPICSWDHVEGWIKEITSNPNLAHAEMYCGTHGCKYGFWGFSSHGDTMIGEFVAASFAEWRANV